MKDWHNIINIGKHKIGKGHVPYIIAEMACAHNGSTTQARKIIDAAVSAKADAVQLQFFVPEHTVTPLHETYPVLQKIAFSFEEWAELFNYGKTQDIDIWVCTYDLPSVELAINLKADGIKLNSADLSNPEMIVEVAKSGIPFSLGTGASTLEEISKGMHLAYEHGARKIILMHGVQNFPTKIEDLHIARIHLLKDVFKDIPVGYGDHTDGEDPFGKVVDLIAVGLGANMLEKHITLDRSEKGIDYQAALEPDEYKVFVETIHKGFEALGSGEVRAFSESDLRYRKFQKKSVVAARQLTNGEYVSRKDVYFVRNTEPGVSPLDFVLIEGKQVKRNIAKNENILIADLF